MTDATGPNAYTTKDIFDRKEQRAVGYFIDLAKKLSEEADVPLSEAIDRLQKEHFCYD